MTYNGLSDRVNETINGVITNFTLDLNTGLTQVLADGTNTYLYGRGRIEKKEERQGLISWINICRSSFVIMMYSLVMARRMDHVAK